jgi:hypothetical protein
MFKNVALSKLLLGVLAIALSSCVPAASSSPVIKEWVRVALAPDNSEINQACDRAYLAGSDSKQIKFLVGGVKREVKNSVLYFYATLRNTYSLCYLYGISLNVTKPTEAPKEQGNLWIKDSPFDLKDTRVSLEFKNSNGEVIDSVQILNGEVPKGNKSLQIFTFPQWTNLQIINMKQSSSFSVLVIQGQAEQRLEFRREDFPGLF